MKYIKFLSFIFIFHFNISQAQLIIDNTSMTPAQLVQNVLVGGGVTVSAVTYSGNIPNSIGKFSTGGNPTNLGLTEGIIMSSGNVMDAPGPNSSGSTGATNGTGSDPQLASLVPGYTVNDAAVLSFTFTPLSDTIRFRYVFGSEEYPEWVGSSYNDVFGFFISGPNPGGGTYNNLNIAQIPGTTLPVTIDNVNASSYSQYYINNAGGSSIELDGFTAVLTAWALVTPCVPYQIKIAIGDAGDSVYDSVVFLESESFSTNAVSVDFNYTMPSDTMAYRGCSNAVLNFNLPQVVPINTDICYEVLGSAVNGVDYQQIDTCITILQGQQTAQLVIVPIDLGVPSGVETVQIVLETNPCQDDTITIYIRDYPPMSLNIPYDTICNGESTTMFSFLSGGVGPFTYEWASGEQTTSIQVAPPGPSVNTYVLTITDACVPHTKTIVDSTILVVHAIPTSDYTTSSDTICLDEDLLATYTGTATVNANYYWNFSGGNIISGSGQGPYQIDWNAPATHSLSLYVEENGCYSDTAYKSVTVLPIPVIDITSDINDGCNPITVQFQDLTNESEQWNWTFQGGNPSSSTIENPTVTYSSAGTFDVTLNVVNIYGCVNTLIFNDYITSHPIPQADFTFAPTVGTPGLYVQFNSSSSSPYVTNWNWDFGNSSFPTTSTLQNDSTSFGETGYQTITLTVTTAYGCTDTISKEILIIDITIPNVFTPNGDGINDFFVIDGIEYVPDCKIMIFNRWGSKVYESDNYKNDWDGENHSDGVYYYIFSLPQNIAEPYHGTVTILK
ncbi:MAG: choice-of-anchor L domain-containing protein [Bacteroidales bacterium]|nr:choice-of-anchor L domain-containing protein [Bacteroidales bacterium]